MRRELKDNEMSIARCSFLRDLKHYTRSLSWTCKTKQFIGIQADILLVPLLVVRPE
jgi:hypothetical protein